MAIRMIPNSIVYNQDCLEAMRAMPDKAYELAIVDPPYGIREVSNRINKPAKCAAKKKLYNTALWDQDKPTLEYFDELRRVSNNQIIWGGNYFTLRNSRGWVVWDKLTEDSKFADCELAWTSFDRSIKKFTYRWNGMLQGDMKNKESRIHPTQKPIALYRWLLHNYAKPGDKILDTHLGSGSSRIAAYQMGFDFTGYELDRDYFEAQEKRFALAIQQQSLFQ